ncbi:DEKNAAC104847 [Brettanomyces naardenensis]|uniref:DEKNAAC104847 n=1 Tax=Brettanomyces naardenensis TaxID=13370 RepID=A0A448YSF8_BRENA|nr:DEKNAAC104847 [Brettanomyces naardenensis]
MSQFEGHLSNQQFRVPGSSTSFHWETGVDENVNAEAFEYGYRILPVKLANDRYQLVGNLGSGSFGSVLMAKIRKSMVPTINEEMSMHRGTLLQPIPNYTRAPSNLVAIKIMNKKLVSLEDYSRVKEVRFILSVRSHPNLVQINDLFIDKLSFKLHIVMEAMDQNLYQLLKARKGCLFSPRTLKSILSQLLAAIRHIHRFRFFHRDVKPENILVMPSNTFYGSKENVPTFMRGDSYVIKLADYGLARHASNLRPFTAYVSTRWYRSPEILLRKQSYSFPVDIWAFGCVAVEAATFRPLLPGQNELDQTWKVLELLGCPERTNATPPAKTPLGGYWKDAQALAAKLGFSMPRLAGTSLSSILPRTDIEREERHKLYDVIKSCLLWDPGSRSSAQELSQCPYFESTVLRGEDELYRQHRRDFFNSLTNLEERPSRIENSTTTLSTRDQVLAVQSEPNPAASLVSCNDENWDFGRTGSKRNGKNDIPNLEPIFTKEVLGFFSPKQTDTEESVPSLEEEYSELNNSAGCSEFDVFSEGEFQSLMPAKVPHSRSINVVDGDTADHEQNALAPLETLSERIMDQMIQEEKSYSMYAKAYLPEQSGYDGAQELPIGTQVSQAARNKNLVDEIDSTLDNAYNYTDSFYDWASTQ